MKKKWDVCGNVRDGYTVCWGDAIVYYLNVVCMLFVSVLILEVMVVLGLTPLELMQCLVPPSDLLQGGL